MNLRWDTLVEEVEFPIQSIVGGGAAMRQIGCIFAHTFL